MMPDAPSAPPLMPSFKQPIPDEKRLCWMLAGGWGRIFGVVAMLVVAILLLGVVTFLVYRDHQYESQGQVADGYVIDKHIKVTTNRKGRQSNTYLVKYSFNDQSGQRFEDEESVSNEVYRRIEAMQPHAVEYLTSDPTVNRLKLPRTATAEWILSCIAIALLIGSYFYFVGSRKRGRRRAAVIFHGQARPGQIVVSEQRGRGKNRRYVLGYRYVDLNGQEKVAKEMNVSRKVMNQFPYGTLVTVLVDPNDLKRPEPDLYGVRPMPAMQ